MPRAVGIARALEDAGLDVVVHRGWETRGSEVFRPRGVVVHHTGPWSTVEGMINLLLHGRRDLPGPLCHVGIEPGGGCHVIAAGRANHAGPGGWKGLSGNTSVFGIEAIHSGSRADLWPEAQIDAFIISAGALARLAGVGPEWICGHKEWTTRKIDPIALDMDEFRARVARWLVPPPQEVKVPPMYDPPLGPIAAVWRDEEGKVIAAASPDGDVYAWGCQWAGNVRGKPYWGDRKVAHIGPPDRADAAYTITATTAERYTLPDGFD